VISVAVVPVRNGTLADWPGAVGSNGFAGSDRYGVRVAHIADVVRKAKPMEGEAPPRLPGARGHAVNRKAMAEGITMFGNLRSALNNVAGMLESHTETA